MYFLALVAASISPTAAPPALTEDEEPQPPLVRTLSAAEMFDLAKQAETAGNLDLAERILKAIIQDEDTQIRSEARFRLAMLYVMQQHLSAAAVLLREILDDEPTAQRVRLELAHVLDLLGDQAGARRALREVQANALPPEVARFVDRYSAALRAQKRIGANFDIALAPDSNINRATRSQTLGTVIGDFVLDEDARQRSGTGLALRGQAYARVPLSEAVNVIGRISGSGDFYKLNEFNDIALAISGGPELRLGADRLTLEAGGLWRWYGNHPYSGAATIGLSYVHPLDRKSEIRGTANAAIINNRVTPILDGESYSASLRYERAVSARAGIGATLNADRQSMRDPAYSTWGGQLTFLGYREFGPVTLVVTATHGRLVADQRALLYPEKRFDRLYRGSVGATFRNLRFGSFAPFLRASIERNRSSVKIYDYRRIRTEIGIARSF